MKRLAALVLAVAAPGCFFFYPDAINQRPSVSIQLLTSGTIARGEMVSLQAEALDPDGDAVTVSWQAFACTTAADPTPDCDKTAFSTGTATDYSFIVPITRSDGVTPVQAVRVLLDGVDDRGAIARPEQALPIAVGDAPPLLALRQVSAHNFVVNSHVQLFADVTDPDDAATTDTLVWTVFTPTNDATYDLTDQPPPTAQPGHRGEAKLLDAHATGIWDVHVAATDPVGGSGAMDFSITITDDEPPCIRDEQPLAQDGTTVPLFAPTNFVVPVVSDDLDTYPPLTGDIDAGAATFAWTLQTNGGARVPLAISGNTVALDPAKLTPGDILDLRVEVADRISRTANFAACPDASATCTFNPIDATCAQRQTWRIEVQ